MDRAPLPDLDSLDREALRALLLAQKLEEQQLKALLAAQQQQLRDLEAELDSHRQMLAEQAEELRSRSERIEHLKLMLEKLRHMMFGRKSEKIALKIEQMELELEEHETTQAGAMREAFEEANAKIEIETLLAVYSIPRLSQVQLIYRAHLAAPGIAPGPESEAVGFFGFDEVPWQDLAFPSVHWALGHHRESLDRTGFAPFNNPPGEFGDLRQGL